ncbi:ArsR family transcriptional regulator [Isoalcanivorax pacificus W11-5]|uniref:ArsR family transcriptional regulator n=1 Tax=Isoalcanivorax pacificus W11-5 TaxID=391936 RepID=A0A0B4XGH9_9GAMM|nr:metalloregulator ArsR/SmtB family transcription factor [Isoalcanivorax pacificus]AJD47214.1 ArsR family transcriptional regulator [Isoalcanivorax pacificus W11-5]
MQSTRDAAQAAALDQVFHALSDGTRRAMLRELAAGERKVGELAAPFSMSLAAASKHVRVLERAGLLQREVRGRVHICRLQPARLKTAGQWLRFYEQFWTERLDALEAALQAEAAPQPDTDGPGESPDDTAAKQRPGKKDRGHRH